MGQKKTIVINKNNIKILGISHNQPTIIDGLKSTGFADINANNTHFANIKFINFVKTSGNNGAVINSKNSHNLSIKNCYFHNNVVHNGAALFSQNSSIEVYDSTFLRNNARNGGAIFSDTNSNITIYRSYFSLNSASFGSAIYNQGLMNIFNSKFYNNKVYFTKLNTNNPVTKYTDNILINALLVNGNNFENSIQNTGKLYINGRMPSKPNSSSKAKITLKLNSKYYSIYADSNNLARFKIPTTNKFLLGKYTYYLSFSGNSLYSSAKSNGKVTIIKKYLKTVKTTKIKQKYVKGRWINVNSNENNHKYPNAKYSWKYTDLTKITVYEPVKKWRRTYKYSNSLNYKYISVSPKYGSKIKTKYSFSSSKKYRRSYISNPYISASYGVNPNDKQIKSLASQITKNSKTDFAKANAIYSWVQRNIKYQVGLNHTAKDTLNYRKGNCVGNSRLTSSLMRSVGIPTRYERKVIRTDSGQFSAHVWNQVYIKHKGAYRWVIVDASCINPSKPYSVGTLTNWHYLKPLKGGHEYDTTERPGVWVISESNALKSIDNLIAEFITS